MIQIAKWTKQFVKELYKQVRAYGSVYVTEDGQIHRSEKAAVRRAELKSKLAHLNREDETDLRFIRVELESPYLPTTVDELVKEFYRQEELRRRERRSMKPVDPTPHTVLTDADIEKELAAIAAKKSGVKPIEPAKVEEIHTFTMEDGSVVTLKDGEAFGEDGDALKKGTFPVASGGKIIVSTKGARFAEE